MNGTPSVSCMCLTFGRPHLLEEAIESFLRQDYSGQKELIVLNDFDRQTLHFDHPDVHVINLTKRFRTVGEKRNACAGLSSFDTLFVWDDDDIFLPHRISYSMRMLDPAKGFFKPTRAFTLNGRVLGGPAKNLYHSASCFSRSLFDRARGYRHMGSGQDLELEKEFQSLIGRGKNFEGITPKDIYYLYRWGGTQSFHLSAFGRDLAGKPPGQDRVAEFVKRKCSNNEIAQGQIALQPHWKCDYSDMVRGYLTRLAEQNPS
jgi:glycosyltransferase involved in cell wall biosynthesis